MKHFNSPQEALQHHVTGAIERGESVAIVEKPAVSEFAKIHEDALAWAQSAAEKENKRLGPEVSRGFDCGFGWVQIAPGNSPYARFLKSIGAAEKHWNKGVYIWGSRLHNISTQSISVHVAASTAYADHVRDMLKNINLAPSVIVGSRYD